MTKARSKASQAKARQRQEQEQWKGQPARQENEERSLRDGGTKTRKTHKPVNTAQNGRTRMGITLTAGLMTGGRATGAQICGLTLHGNILSRT